MFEGLRVAAVVPAYNESRLIETTLTTMPDLVDLIVVVDDASQDDTADKVARLSDPRIELVQHSKNTGVGGAILDGHRRALELGADVNVVMAGDAQMDPDYLPALLAPVAFDHVDFAKANRFYSRGSYAGMPWHRVAGNLALSFMTKASSGYWHLFDPQNGYTAITRSALERLSFDKIDTGYPFENSLLINLNILRVRAKDVPIPAKYGDETSSMRLGHVMPRLAWTLVRGFWQRIFYKYVLQSFSPVAVMLFAGLFLLLPGLALGVFATVYSIGSRTASAGTVVLAVGLTLTGIYLLINSWILDIHEDR